MLYKRIEDEERIIYVTEGSDIFVSNSMSEEILKEKIENERFNIVIEPFNLEEKRLKLKKLIVLLTTSCNLRCRYCYLNYGDYTNDNKNENINLVKAKKAIDMIIKDFPEGIGFVQFFGGEPLIAFQELKTILQYISQLCEEKGIALPKFGMVTNGLLISDEIVEFLNENKFSLTISVDGDKEVHNLVRKKIGKSDSFECVSNNMVAYSEKIRIPLFFEMTLNREHILSYSQGQMIHWLDTIKELGFRSGIMGVVEFGKDKTLDICASDITILKEMYEEFVDYFFDELKSEAPQFYNVDICKLVWMLLKKDLSDTSCAAGVYQLTLSTDGKFYPCPKFADCELEIGSVDAGNIKYDNMKLLINDDTRMECQSCWLKHICKSYCYALKYRNKDAREVIPIRCIHMSLLTENATKNIVRAKKSGDLPRVIEAIRAYWSTVR